MSKKIKFYQKYIVNFDLQFDTCIVMVQNCFQPIHKIRFLGY